MKFKNNFRRRALLLFLIVSVMPAITVSALWYAMTRDISGAGFMTIGGFVMPIALVGLIPAFVLGFLFAELLAIPIRRLHQGIIQISLGNYDNRVNFSRISEFYEMAQALNSIASNLQLTLSQKESETGIITSERNKLRTILDNMDDGVFALDSANRIMLFNQAAQNITGLKLESVAGRSWQEVLTFEDMQRHRPVLEWLINEPKQVTKKWSNLSYQAPDGEKHINIQAARVFDDPNGICVLGTFHDITQREQLEEMELNFVAIAAHELRTPLTTIKGYIDILQLELAKKLDKEHSEFLNRSSKGLERLTGLVNNLLNVSRIEQGGLSFTLNPTSWKEFLKNVEPHLQETAAVNGRKLVIRTTGTLPKVAMDELSMTEVLTNLVDNAIKHTKRGDTITITSHKTHEGLETTVSDHGTGIPIEAQARLFSKFFRIEGHSQPGGTGLGLYICKAIVEAHYGYIWVDSKLGKGTTFGFSLPTHKIIAGKSINNDNKGIIRGAHGWIKTHTTRRRRTAHK